MTNPAEKQHEASLSGPSAAAWYQVTLSAIGDAVLTTDLEGRVIYMNPVAESLTGWVAAEAYGRPVEEVFRIISEETGQAVKQPIRQVIETGLVRGMANHTLLVARDGTRRPIDDSAAPVRDAAGEPIGVVMVFRDIGEQRDRERAVREALEYAESIIDTVRDPLLVLDADLRVRSANCSFYRDFGVTREATEGRLVYELGNGQWDIPELRSALEDVLPKDDTFRDFEVTHEFEGIGRRRMLLNGRKVRRPGDGTELILLAIEDATPTWRSGVEFADNRERYRVIVEGAVGFAIFTFDTDGVITSWNTGAREMLGYTEEEILGENFRIIFTPEDLRDRQADEEMRIAAREGRALDERWHLKKGGELFWAQGLVMPLRDDADELRGFLKIIRDKTEERHLQDALRKRTEQLEEADRHKNQFLAMLAHELRNPLAAVRNAIEVSARTGSKEDLQWSRDVTARQVANFSHLIKDLLDVARITEGKVQVNKELIDAVPVVRHAIEAVRPILAARKHEFQSCVTSTELRLEADSTRLEQILVNLLTNAAKYTPSGGRIELSAGAEGGEVVFRVRDNGLGIPADLLPKVFDLFIQADRSLDRSEGGLGIGLTLVRSLAELHGGTVTATSDGDGKGSEFVVRLPAAVGARARPAGGGDAAASGARGFRVLVVDDNADTAQGMAKLLEISGHDVRVAHDGVEALEVAREYRPEIMLLDIGLPGMDGYELATRLRQEGWCEGAVLVAVSGYGEERARDRSEAAGFDHHLVKPVKFDTLLDLIATFQRP
ncbi:PAS domain S-box protein [Paludisphaera sp.]|uniref:PAS domain-containing hybrid sensor histidine kinase/response regulator n=1 Tax=Paludisphaera sp. TaxID=2017432 RepID=UPI00301E1C15